MARFARLGAAPAAALPQAEGRRAHGCDHPYGYGTHEAIVMPLCLHLTRVYGQVLPSNQPWLVDQIAIAPATIHTLAMGVPAVLNCHHIASRAVLATQGEERLEERSGPVHCPIHLKPPDEANAEISFRGTHG